MILDPAIERDVGLDLESSEAAPLP
jgi:hypothetical protein